MKKLLTIALAGVLLLVAASAQADLLISSTSGLVFNDDFEGGTVGQAPDNGALPGSWSVASGAGVVVDSSYGSLGTTLIPAAYQGGQLLGVTGNWGNVSMLLESTVSSGSVWMEWMMYLPSEIPLHGFFTDNAVTLTNDVPDPATNIGVVQQWTTLGGDDTYQPTGVTYQADMWQRWVVDMNFDTAMYTLSVDGQASGPLDMRNAGAFSQLDLYWGSTSALAGGSYFIDAVPEPSTVALLATGLVGLLACARLKRK